MINIGFTTCGPLTASLSPNGSFRRRTGGRIFHEDGTLKMPLSAQAHHWLVDRFHLARFYKKIQELLSKPACPDETT